MRQRFWRALAAAALVVPGVVIAGAGVAQASTAPPLSASALSVMKLTDNDSFSTTVDTSITSYRDADEASSRPFSVVRMNTLVAGGYATRSVCHPTDLTVTSSVAGFCWDSTDDTTANWYPQGVTGSGDGMNGSVLYPLPLSGLW